jgi:hypothetical protein
VASLAIRPIDAAGQALPVPCHVSISLNGRVVQTARCPPGASASFDNLIARQTYLATATAGPFQVSAQFSALATDELDERILCFLSIKHADPRLPAFALLDDPLRRVLERSPDLDEPEPLRALSRRPLAERTLEVREPAIRALSTREIEDFPAGNRRWERLAYEQKAGLLNLFAKMRSLFLLDGSSVWSHVDRLVKIDRDRIYAIVPKTLAARAKAAPWADSADDSLHKPPEGFVRAGSIKSKEPFGNLQLTFARDERELLPTLIDADVDNAAGLEHGEQVIRNWIGSGVRKLLGGVTSNLPEDKTHPYDIHQILIFHQVGEDRRNPDIGKYEPCYAIGLRGGPPGYEI